MGRRKIEIKRIDGTIRRQITLSKRKRGLFTQAEQLAILCRAEIAIIIFSGCGKLYTYTNTTMDSVLSRYSKRLKVPDQTGQSGRRSKHVIPFLKRRLRLLKMAKHLSILCNSEIAVIIFSDRGELYEYANSTMDSVLSIYNEKLKEQNQKDQSKLDQAGQSEICNQLVSEITELRLSLRQKSEKEDLHCLSLLELDRLKDEITERFVGVKNKMEQLENLRSRKRKKPTKECNDSSSIPVLVKFE